MPPVDLDPAKSQRDDDDLTSPSSDSGDDWDDDTPLTDTMDPERADKIDSIMQSFCAALDSKLVLFKKEKPSSDKATKDGSRAKLKEEKNDDDDDDDEDDDAKDLPPGKLKKESEAAPDPQPTSTKEASSKGLPILQRIKQSVAVTLSSGAGPFSGPGADRTRAAIRLAPRTSRASPAVSEAAISPSPSATRARGPAPPPPPSGPPAPTASVAPTPAPSAVPTADSTPLPTTSSRPPQSFPTIPPSGHLLHSQFFHLPDLPPVSTPITSPPSQSQHARAPVFGAAAQNLQQASSRPPIQQRGEPNAPSRRFIQTSSRSLAPQGPTRSEPTTDAPPPPPQHWQPTPTLPFTSFGNQGPFGGPNVGSRGLDQGGVRSPDFHGPFNSPPDPLYHNFANESLHPPGGPSPSDLYPFPPPEPGGSRRRYQFGSPPNIGEQESDGYHSRKSSAVSHSAVPESSPASAAAIDKAPDRDGRRKRQKAATEDSTTPNLKAGNRKFACPYYKRNRKKYCKWTSCPGPGWEEVHRVKTHLYRRHGRPPQCPRCWAVFSTEDDLQAHQQQNPPCETSHNMRLVEGYSKEQEKKLRSRKKAQPNMTDEDKWREIYMILFPDDDQDSIPNPYYDDADSDEGVDGGGGGTSTAGKELDDYASFVRREMPTLVRRELEVLFENEFKDVDEQLKPRVAKIVLDLQPKLLNLYKQSQLPLSEYGPQNASHMPSHTPGSNSETGTGVASTISPASGTDTNSTPGVVDLTYDSGNADVVNGESGTIPYLDSTFGIDMNNLDTSYAWDGGQYQVNPYSDATQYQGIGAADDALGGSGLDWGVAFDQLLNPALLVPSSADMLAEVQGDLHEGAKRKYDGN